MDHKQVTVVKRSHSETDTAELLEIWTKNDREEYTDEAFEAIGQLLHERNVPVPEQKEFLPSTDREAIQFVSSAQDSHCLGLAEEFRKYIVTGRSRGLGLGSLEVERLYIGAQGLCLAVSTENGKNRDVVADWEAVRELENKLNTKRSFILNMGPGNEDLRFSVKVRRDDVPELSQYFKKLPDSVFCGKCPACAGLVSDGVCKSCGAALAQSVKARGLKYILGGLALTIIGILIAVGILSFSAANSPIVVFWWGPPLAGVLLMLRGWYEFVLKRKL